jgi:hypothetical protein
VVPTPRTPLRADRLRALNLPVRVSVTTDPTGLPQRVQREDGELPVEEIRELWRIDDEWWRSPIIRCYADVVLAGGKRVILYQDLVTGDWWIQQP